MFRGSRAPEDERTMWIQCLRTLNTIDTPRLVHYGSYETNLRARQGFCVNGHTVSSSSSLVDWADLSGG
jgi:hypothetical protein